MFYLPPRIDFTTPFHYTRATRPTIYTHIHEWTRPKNISYINTRSNVEQCFYIISSPVKMESIDLYIYIYTIREENQETKRVLTFDPTSFSNRSQRTIRNRSSPPFRYIAAIRGGTLFHEDTLQLPINERAPVFFKWNASRSPTIARTFWKKECGLNRAWVSLPTFVAHLTFETTINFRLVGRAYQS